MKCNICPRECNKDRSINEVGVCAESDAVSVARVGLHMWEEPCISGKEGSGTIFLRAVHYVAFIVRIMRFHHM